jgi:hypothetical protein
MQSLCPNLNRTRQSQSIRYSEQKTENWEFDTGMLQFILRVIVFVARRSDYIRR